MCLCQSKEGKSGEGDEESPEGPKEGGGHIDGDDTIGSREMGLSSPSKWPPPSPCPFGRKDGREATHSSFSLFLIDGGKTGEAGAHLKKGPPKGQKGGNAPSAPQKADLPIFSA